MTEEILPKVHSVASPGTILTVFFEVGVKLLNVSVTCSNLASAVKVPLQTRDHVECQLLSKTVWTRETV